MFYQVTGKEITVVVADTSGNVKTSRLLDLLPNGYLTKQNLDKLTGYKNK